MVTGFGSCQLSQRGNTMMSRSEVEQPRVGAPSAPVAPVRSGASGAVNIGNYIIISSSGACGAENPPCTTSPNVAVGGLGLAVPAKSFAKRRFEQKTKPTPRQQIPRKFVAVEMPNLLVTARASRVARSSEARTQELQRLCPLFAERHRKTASRRGLGRTW
jgi:hypothetical protein